jgi:hypothetical protein
VNNVESVEVVPVVNGSPFTPGAFKAVRTPSGLHSQASGDFTLSSDGNTTLSFRAVTEADVEISSIAFDLLVIR